MTLQLNSVQAGIRIHLMSCAQLVMSDDKRIRHFLPPIATQQMLCFDRGITQEAAIGDHLHVVFSGHGVPFLQADLGVVNSEVWSDDASEALPVLGLLETAYRCGKKGLTLES